ncbi:filamentous hemagglutinin N-terminal domain-containing protein, partial [Crocosphaera sp.]|uniref:two-partner secretion domain-containing protein n=1 Tax=Crocosphaera sp. TaxID=2729996 RepID=UPI002633CF3A
MKHQNRHKLFTINYIQLLILKIIYFNKKENNIPRIFGHLNPLIIATFALIIESLLSVIPTQAQIIPDNTLGNENSQVTPNQLINGIPSELIQGGAIRGNNLFHSFSEFNIQEGTGAYFANPQGIINILGRVTGNNLSEIMGTLGVLGNGNLFLVNPNGIIFGDNAQLDVRGSFFATTSDGFIFGNGEEFSATNPGAAPLLVDNTSGINFSGSGRANITVSGDLGVQPFMSMTIHGDMVTLNGSVTASGGNVSLLGETVALVEEATVDVSNSTKGGTVFIGGGFGGRGNIPTAQTTLMGENVVINADGIGTGDGGNVSVWSENNTNFQGTITAKGGILGGNGGFIETSARDNLTVSGTVNASAVNGDAGTWLIDPTDITITNGGGGNIGGSTVDVANINSALNAGTNVTITTDIGGNDEGNITQKAGAAIIWSSGSSLTLNANNNITLNDEINSSSTTGDGGNITLNAGQDINTQLLDSGFSRSSGKGGDITLTAQRNIITQSIDSRSLNSGNIQLKAINGDIQITGTVDSSVFINGTGQAGNIQLEATNGSINLSRDIFADSSFGNGGNITLTAGKDINTQSLNSGFSESFGKGGDITLNAQGNIITQSIDSRSLNSGNIQLKAINGDIQITGTVDSRVVVNRIGQAGNIQLEATNGSINLSRDIFADSSFGNGGNITLTA